MKMWTSMRLASAAVAGLMFMGAAQAVPTYVVNNGRLTGINDIEISGLGTWDVAFIDGSLSSVFGTSFTFDFTNQADAFSAAAALMTAFTGNAGQAGWDIDMQPGRTIGCAPIDRFDYCAIATPFEITTNPAAGLLATHAVFENFPNIVDPAVSFAQSLSSFDTANMDDVVLADWTQHPGTTPPPTTGVPAPGTAALLAAALVAYLLTNRRRVAVIRGSR